MIKGTWKYINQVFYIKFPYLRIPNIIGFWLEFNYENFLVWNTYFNLSPMTLYILSSCKYWNCNSKIVFHLNMTYLEHLTWCKCSCYSVVDSHPIVNMSKRLRLLNFFFVTATFFLAFTEARVTVSANRL